MRKKKEEINQRGGNLARLIINRMSKVTLAVTLLLTSVGTLTTNAADYTLLENGGFEEYVAGGTGPHWEFGTIGNTPQSLQAYVVANEAFEGKNAQVLAESGASLANDTLRVLSQGYDVLDGQLLTLRFHTNIKSMTDSRLEYSFVFYDEQGGYLNEVKGTAVTAATAGYEEFVLKTSPPKSASKFKVRFDSIITTDGGSYQLLLDNVRVFATPNTLPIGDNAQVGVVGGDLEFFTSSGTFTDVELDFNKKMVAKISTSATVTDNTGRAEGWALKVSSTDFYSEPLNDPSGSGAKYVLRLPASSVSMSLGPISLLAGQPVDAVGGPFSKTITLSSSAQTLMAANAGYGSGSYKAGLRYDMVVPKTLPIDSVEGGKFVVGDQVGTRATVYKATVNYTAGVGL